MYSSLLEIIFTIGLKDITEIACISYGLYLIITWLSVESRGNLLIYFYAYIGCFVLSYALRLSIITSILFFGAPAIFCLFIILHEERLQKNFITLKRITAPALIQGNWVDDLVSTLLHALYKKIPFTCVIQRADILDPYIISSYPLDADISKEFMIFLLKNTTSEKNFMWINKYGKIKAIECTWQFVHENADEHEYQKETPHQMCISVTAKSDACIIIVNPTLKSFECFVQGTLIDHIRADQLHMLLKQLLAPTTPKDTDNPHASSTPLYQAER